MLAISSKTEFGDGHVVLELTGRLEQLVRGDRELGLLLQVCDRRRDGIWGALAIPARYARGDRVPRRLRRSMGLLDGWQFCPRCGATATQADGCSTCSACGYQVWAASVPGAQALAVNDAGEVLLGRRNRDPGRGFWDIPGGFLDEGEDPTGGLRREFIEETGLDVEVDAFLGIWIESYAGRFVHCATWLVRPVGGQLRAGDDLYHVAWFAADRLPAAADFAFPTHVEIVEVWARSRQ